MDGWRWFDFNKTVCISPFPAPFIRNHAFHDTAHRQQRLMHSVSWGVYWPFSALYCSSTVGLLDKHITVCEILHRHRGFYTDHMNLSEYNAKVDAANAALRQLATTSDSHIIDFWEHRDLKQSGRIHSMWHGDGVHLRRTDQIYLKRSVRGAILRQINLRRYVNYLYNNVISYNIVWPPALPCPRLSPTRPQPCRSRDNVPGGHVSSPPYPSFPVLKAASLFPNSPRNNEPGGHVSSIYGP